MADLDLYRLSLSGAGNKVLKTLEDLGVGKEARQIIADRMLSLAVYAGESVISKVPIDTGELRNDDIFIEHPTPTFLTAKVLIKDKIHDSYGKRSPKSSVWLANFLDKKSPFNRSQDSHAVAGYTSEAQGENHQGWIAKAIDEFNQNDKERDFRLNG